MSYELYTTKHWMVMPAFVHGILPTLMYNSNNHIAINVEKKKPYLVASGTGEVIRDSQVTEDGEVIPRRDGWTGESLLANMKEPFVNVIPIDGPITRNGDACSYGSKEIRDWMMEAADNKYCRAHVLVVNTPGGSAWAKNDFQQAIEFAHDCGQRVYMLVDGLCASAGMYLASFCDEVYVVNLKDQLGCVGVMASFFTIKNGEKNQFDSETYHEYYATKSINKNKEYRDIAENDDATLLIAELDKLEDEFRKDMQAAFPNATDEHLDGKVFDASEVMDILCDGQMLLGDLVARAFAVANGEEEPIARTANRIIVPPDDETDDDDKDEQAKASSKVVIASSGQNNVSQNNSTTMKNEKYQKIAQLLDVDDLVVSEEGVFLNTPLLDKLSEKLDKMEEKAGMSAVAQEQHAPAAEEAPAVEEQPAAEEAHAAEEAPAAEEEKPAEEAPAEETPAEEEEKPAEEAPAAEEEKPGEEEHPASEESIENAKAEIDKIQDTLHNAEQMIADKDKEIESLKAAADQKEIDFKAKDETIENLTKERDEANKSIEELKASIETLNQQIENQKTTIDSLKTEVKELSEKETPMVNAGAGIPAGNGTGEAPKVHEKRITRQNMSYEHCREVAKERMEAK